MKRVKRLIFGVNGAGGGTGGPYGSYRYLQKYFDKENVEVYNFDTIPSSVSKNVRAIIDLITTKFNNYEQIYLIGWSMGGAVVIQVAQHLREYIHGLVLLATQTAECDGYQTLKIPILLVHGAVDTTLSVRCSKSIRDGYPNKKQLIILKSLGHVFSSDAEKFANFLAVRMSQFFEWKFDVPIQFDFEEE